MSETTDTSERRLLSSDMICTRCGAREPGSRRHCGASLGWSLPLAMWDGDAALAPGLDPASLQRAPDVAGVPAEAFADLDRALPGRVETGGGLIPGLAPVFSTMFDRGHWTQIRGRVVGSVPIVVVNFIFGRDESVDHPVLVGFDVAPLSDLPSDSDVSVPVDVTTRLAFRHRLSGRQRSNSSAVSASVTTSVASPSLGSSGEGGGAVEAGSLGHGPIVLSLLGMCHRTFAALSLFDGHRKASGERGVCLDPAELEGYEFRDGCWRGPEATDEMREQWAKMRSEPSAPVAELNLTNLGG